MGGRLQVLRPRRPGRPLHRQAGGAAQPAQGQLQGQAGSGGRDERSVQGQECQQKEVPGQHERQENDHVASGGDEEALSNGWH